MSLALLLMSIMLASNLRLLDIRDRNTFSFSSRNTLYEEQQTRGMENNFKILNGHGMKITCMVQERIYLCWKWNAMVEPSGWHCHRKAFYTGEFLFSYFDTGLQVSSIDLSKNILDRIVNRKNVFTLETLLQKEIYSID